MPQDQNPEPTFALSIKGSMVVVGKDEYQVAAELIHILDDYPSELTKAVFAALGISEDAFEHAVHSLGGGCMDPHPGIMGSCRRCATQTLEAGLE